MADLPPEGTSAGLQSALAREASTPPAPPVMPSREGNDGVAETSRGGLHLKPQVFKQLTDKLERNNDAMERATSAMTQLVSALSPKPETPPRTVNERASPSAMTSVQILQKGKMPAGDAMDSSSNGTSQTEGSAEFSPRPGQEGYVNPFNDAGAAARHRDALEALAMQQRQRATHEAAMRQQQQQQMMYMQHLHQQQLAQQPPTYRAPAPGPGYSTPPRALNPGAAEFTQTPSPEQSGMRRPPPASAANAVPLGGYTDDTRRLQAENEELRRQLASHGHFAGKSDYFRAPKVEPPEAYEGDPEKVNAFIDDLQGWFAHYPHLTEQQKVSHAVSRLKDTAKTWYESRRREARRAGMETFVSLAAFQAALKAHFLDAGLWTRARNKVIKLKQTGSIHDYNRDFMTITADIPDMGAAERCYHYVMGLRRYTRRQARLTPAWSKVNEDPCSAQYDLFLDLKQYAVEISDDSFDIEPAPRPDTRSTGKRKADAVNTISELAARHSPAERKRLQRERRCYICGGQHMARDCPTPDGKKWRASLNTITGGWEDHDFSYVFAIEAEEGEDATTEPAVNFMDAQAGQATEADFASDASDE